MEKIRNLFIWLNATYVHGITVRLGRDADLREVLLRVDSEEGHSSCKMSAVQIRQMEHSESGRIMFKMRIQLGFS